MLSVKNEMEHSEDRSPKCPDPNEIPFLEAANRKLYEMLVSAAPDEQPGAVLFLDTSARPFAAGFKPIIDSAVKSVDFQAPILRFAGLTRSGNISRAYSRACADLNDGSNEKSKHTGTGGPDFTRTLHHWLKEHELWDLEDRLKSKVVLAAASPRMVQEARERLALSETSQTLEALDWKKHSDDILYLCHELDTSTPVFDKRCGIPDTEGAFFDRHLVNELLGVVKSSEIPMSGPAVRRWALEDALDTKKEIDRLRGGGISKIETRFEQDVEQLTQRVGEIVSELSLEGRNQRILVIDDVLHSGASFHLLLQAASRLDCGSELFNFFVTHCSHDDTYVYDTQGKKVSVVVGSDKSNAPDTDMYSGYSWRYMGEKELYTGVSKNVDYKGATQVEPYSGRGKEGRALRRSLKALSESIATLVEDD